MSTLSIALSMPIRGREKVSGYLRSCDARPFSALAHWCKMFVRFEYGQNSGEISKSPHTSAFSSLDTDYQVADINCPIASV